MATSLWATTLSAGAIGALATLLGALVNHWGQAHRDGVTHQRAVSDVGRERRRQEYVAALSALEACQLLLYRTGRFQPLSPEGAARLSAQVSTALGNLNQAMAAVQLDPEGPDVDALASAVGEALCQLANDLDVGSLDRTETPPIVLVPTIADTHNIQQQVDQLRNVMRHQLARLERA